VGQTCEYKEGPGVVNESKEAFHWEHDDTKYQQQKFFPFGAIPAMIEQLHKEIVEVVEPSQPTVDLPEKTSIDPFEHIRDLP